MAYIINGPTQIGDAGQLNTILGDVTLTNIATTLGDLLYVNGSANLAPIPIGAAGEVLTVVAGIPAWVTPTTTETGFSAIKSGAQGPITAPFTDTTVTTWSVAAPYYDTTGGDFVPATGVYTASTAGTVNVRCGISLASSTNGGARSVSIRYNGTTNVFTMTAQPSANNNIATFLHASSSILLAATDTIEVAISSTAATGNSTVQASPNSWFSLGKNYTP